MSAEFCDWEIRRWCPTDSISELTDLLHLAYRTLLEQGMNFTATTQSQEQTQARIDSGICFIAIQKNVILGTILLQTTSDPDSPASYQEPDVAVISQFGVHPVIRKQGLGTKLLETAEVEAKNHGFKSLQLDTAKPAQGLISYYSKQGFTEISRHKWHGKTYESVVMSKSL